jgi:hypothetical protein
LYNIHKKTKKMFYGLTSSEYSYEINFGQYNGMTVAHVNDINPDYLIYIYRTSEKKSTPLYKILHKMFNHPDWKKDVLENWRHQFGNQKGISLNSMDGNNLMRQKTYLESVGRTENNMLYDAVIYHLKKRQMI